MVKAAPDARTKEMLRSHLEQTKVHMRRMEERLEVLDSHRSLRKTGEAMAVALPKGLIDRFRTDQAGKIARDGYVAEALEIAAYSLLEQLAMRCGDDLTAEAAKANLADEQEMSRKIAATWGDANNTSNTELQEGIAA